MTDTVIRKQLVLPIAVHCSSLARLRCVTLFFVVVIVDSHRVFVCVLVIVVIFVCIVEWLWLQSDVNKRI